MNCVGLLGKRCTCGKYHELPHEPEGPGMAVSRWVYALGIACGVLWTGIAWWLS